MLLAMRHGAAEGILIPLEHREQMRASGCFFLDPPEGFEEVTVPTPLSEAKRIAPAIPATEIAAPAPRQKRRGRGPGD